MLAVSSQRSQSAVLLLSLLLTLLDVVHGEKKSPNAKAQPVISDQSNSDPKISSRTLVSIHRRSGQESYDFVTMDWEKFNGRVPNDAVSIREGEKTYVCRNMKKKCSLGILKDSKCKYEEGNIQDPDSFEVLVNRDKFEDLKWKKIKCTAEVEEVHKNAVLLCEDQNLFVGRRSDEASSLPEEKSAKRKRFEKLYLIKKLRKTKGIKKLETLTGSCKVLTVSNENIRNQELSDFVYEEDKKKVSEMGKETMETIVVTNKENKEATQNPATEKKTTEEKRWDFSYSINKGVKLTLGGKSPTDFPVGIELSHQTTTTNNKGFSIKSERTVSNQVTVPVPAKSKCTVNVFSRQLMVEMPFKAKLTRYFKRGESKIKLISGTYVLRNAGKTEIKIKKCNPLDGNMGSAGSADRRKVKIFKDKQTGTKKL